MRVIPWETLNVSKNDAQPIGHCVCCVLLLLCGCCCCCCFVLFISFYFFFVFFSFCHAGCDCMHLSHAFLFLASLYSTCGIYVAHVREWRHFSIWQWAINFRLILRLCLHLLNAYIAVSSLLWYSGLFLHRPAYTQTHTQTCKHSYTCTHARVRASEKTAPDNTFQNILCESLWSCDKHVH